MALVDAALHKGAAVEAATGVAALSGVSIRGGRRELLGLNVPDELGHRDTRYRRGSLPPRSNTWWMDHTGRYRPDTCNCDQRGC